MKVLICGAGQVGLSIARHLAGEGNDITVIDNRVDVIRKMTDSLEVTAMIGNASHPDVLDRAGARDAEMLIAVTHFDEVNMMACLVAHSLFEVPEKIARIRAQTYLDPTWADLYRRENLPIDLVISPEIEVARAISRRLEVPGAFDMIPHGEGRLRVIGVRCNEGCPVINTPLRQLTEIFPRLNIVVLGILREDRVIVPRGEDQMLVGDEVYFVTEYAHLERAMAAFGHEEKEARRMAIVGGGNIGLFLAEDLERTHGGLNLKLIELDTERARTLAGRLTRTVVINGDALDRDILEEASIHQSEAIIAVSNDDEVNILAALLAKRAGCPRALALINNPSYASLVGPLGIDVAVSPRESTVSTILQRIRRGRIHAVHSVRDGLAEIVEAEALETSPLVGSPLRDVKLPSGILIGALIRRAEVIIPRGDTVIKPRDRVVTFVAKHAIKKFEQLFAVRMEFF
jgi:trk system potassium uptake protein TrkA